jgi:enamine deaminase RidA (YjgF/YER057c/UK114 family)
MVSLEEPPFPRKLVFVSGATGFDYSSMSIAEGLLEQTEQCLKNIASALPGRCRGFLGRATRF